MCLAVLAWQMAPFRLVLVANRDEFHARDAAPLQPWARPALLAGRDLAAGGTWCGVDRRGRVALVTNYRGLGAPARAPSRGTLVPAFLGGDASPERFVAELATEASRYAGFSLLVADREQLAFISNGPGGAPRVLGPGLHGLSNGGLDAPWPKIVRGRARLAAWLAAPPGGAASALDVLADRDVAADDELPDTGGGRELERRLSPPFIVGAEYGTRCTTALLLGADGRGEIVERPYRADGVAGPCVRFALPADAA